MVLLFCIYVVTLHSRVTPELYKHTQGIQINAGESFGGMICPVICCLPYSLLLKTYLFAP